MGEQVKVTLPPLGKPIIEAIGFTGTDCRTATEALERSLSGGKGGVVVEKPEMNMVSDEVEQEIHQTY